MPHDYRLPLLGADMESGTLVEWKIRPGQAVRKGDVVGVIETDKGAIDLEIFEDAVVEALVVEPGTRVTVGAALARLAGDAPAGYETPVRPQPPAAATAAAPAPVAAPSQAGDAPPAPARVRISPAARRRAAESHLDPATVTPSGSDGAITLADVERALVARAAASAPAAARDTIAAAMTRAKREIPHYYLWTTIDCEVATRWLAAHNARVPVTERLLFTALVLRAVALAAAERPGFNGYWNAGSFAPSEDVHLGVAIARRGGGLVAPALLDAGRKALPLLMSEFRDLVTRARTANLRSRELAAATLTVTSLGDIGVDGVLPIIYPPQVAIVGVGQQAARPWVVDGAVVARPTLTLSLGADHRVSDGRAGAQFLTAIRDRLAAPEAL
jgi:pyruvate dehydrogenase E2 component (dihydrolipoamide acetyltransferase)